MLTEEDRRRLYETRHDISALASPAGLTGQAAMQGAAALSRDDLVAARAVLRAAAASAVREKSETDVERVSLQQAIDAAIRRYGYIRGKVQDALLNVDPTVTVAPEEMERRHRLFGRVFRAVQSDLERLGHGLVIEMIGSAARSLSDEPDLAPLGYAASLAGVQADAEAAASNLNRENDEDVAAMTALRDARGAVDRVAEAHALLVRSILTREGRKDEIGRFVLAADPAYAARRAARAPIDAEPGIGAVDAEAAASPPPAA